MPLRDLNRAHLTYLQRKRTLLDYFSFYCIIIVAPSHLRFLRTLSVWRVWRCLASSLERQSWRSRFWCSVRLGTSWAWRCCCFPSSGFAVATSGPESGSLVRHSSFGEI